MQSLGEEIAPHWKLFSTDFDDVSRHNLSASSSFQLTVHFDFAVLDHELGMSASSCNGSQLQELIQTEFSRSWVGIRHSRGLLSVKVSRIGPAIESRSKPGPARLYSARSRTRCFWRAGRRQHPGGTACESVRGLTPTGSPNLSSHPARGIDLNANNGKPADGQSKELSFPHRCRVFQISRLEKTRWKLDAQRTTLTDK